MAGELVGWGCWNLDARLFEIVDEARNEIQDEAFLASELKLETPIFL